MTPPLPNFPLDQGRFLKHGRYLVLSPHSDDAAFSIGCTVKQLAKDRPITIATVFNVSNFSRFPNKTNTPWITAIRTQEDQQFAADVGCELINLGFIDAIIRVRPKSISSLFQAENELNLDEITHIASRLGYIVQSGKYTAIFAPLAIGNHIDHKSTKYVAQALSKLFQVQVFFYEDQPYAALDPVNSKTVCTHLRIFHRLDVRSCPKLLAMKKKQLAFYDSQPAAKRMANLLLRTQTPINESIWYAPNF